MLFEENTDFANSEIQGERLRQEDFSAFALLDDSQCLYGGLLAILADGMGGHLAGDEASKIAVNSAYSAFYNSKLDMEKSLENAVYYANAQIADFSTKNAKEGCGATLVFAYIDKEKKSLYWASVGDSLLYLLRGGKLHRLNADHSLWPELKAQAEQGLISMEEALDNSHILRSALDGNALELVDISAEGFALEAGDIVILSSDGIDTLEESEIEDFIESRNELSAMGIACSLLNLVENKKKQGQDNTSVMVVKV